MSSSRYDRQLMRQRGAGNRNVATTDFGLSFGFGPAAARSERQQMRQRGAASRKADNVDFGLDFRTSASSDRRSASLRRSREPSVTRSRRSASVLSNKSGRQKTPALRDHVDLDPRDGTSQSAKRRRLTMLDHALEAADQNGLRASTTPRRQRPSSMFQINTIEENAPQPEYDDAGAMADPEDYGKENTPPQSTKSTPNRKKRKAISQQSIRLNPDPEQNSDYEQEQEVSDHYSESADSGLVVQAPYIDQFDRLTTTTASKGKQPLRNPSTDESSKKRRKKRKSVNLVRKKKTRPSLEQAIVNNFDVTQTSEQGSEAGSEAPIASKSSRNIRSLRDQASRTSPIASSPTTRREVVAPPVDNEDTEDEYNPDDYSPEPPTPAVAQASKAQRKKMNQSAARKAQAKTTSRSRRSVSSSTSSRPTKTEPRRKFPVEIHRLTNLNTLPTIAEDGISTTNHTPSEEVDGENDPTNAILSRRIPNSIEVLAQVIRESISAAVDKIPSTMTTTTTTTSSSKSSSQSRALLARKTLALTTLGTSLNDRLFDMATAVENRLHLESRLRKVKREKAELQAKWMAVRRQREEVALKCDEVRRMHWEEEAEREERWAVGEMVGRVKMGLEMGGQEIEEGESLEYLLRSVAGSVSRKGGQDGAGGLLDRIKGFNAELEGLAGVLEGNRT